MKTSKVKGKKIDAWAVVNKNLEENVEQYPNLYSAAVYFSESLAQNHLKDLHPKNCSECGRKNKPQESHLKVLPIEIHIKK